MKLRDWLQSKIINSTYAIAAIPATVQQPSIARISGDQDKSAKIEHSIKKTATREQLMQLHPPIVEGCLLVDILALADPIHDFNEHGLINPIILCVFARYLLDTGQIKPVKAN